ncbi:MAG TPA: zinc ribbon domain-containing protein [Microbacteriaceae bacterium]|nr:zinc ribbon domain-containing protein [Microbacteriaceae bacterium]
MGTCEQCGASLQPGAKFCVVCGARIAPATHPAFATSTLTGSGLTVAISTAAICAAIAAGVFVLVRSLL